MGLCKTQGSLRQGCLGLCRRPEHRTGHPADEHCTDFLRGIIAPVDGMGGVTLSCLCQHSHCYPLEEYIWWVSSGHGDGNNREKKQCSWWCAACGSQYDWRAPNRIQLSANANGAKVLKAHAAPLWLCDNLVVNALKLLANQQIDGGSPIQRIVTGLHERIRRGIMDGLRNFTPKHQVDPGEEQPQFSEAFPEAVIREGADELTLRDEEVGSLRTIVDTKHIELDRWGPPLVDADWHASFTKR